MEQEILTLGGIVNIILRTSIIFFYAFLLLRFLGKRHLKHLMYTDLMVIIAFGSAVGDVMIYGENVVHLYASMIAITVVTVIVKVLEGISTHSDTAHDLLEGKARLLVDEGKFIRDSLGRENLNEATVLSLLREKNIDGITSLKKVFIEPDGELSVIHYEEEKRLS